MFGWMTAWEHQMLLTFKNLKGKQRMNTIHVSHWCCRGRPKGAGAGGAWKSSPSIYCYHFLKAATEAGAKCGFFLEGTVSCVTLLRWGAGEEA